MSKALQLVGEEMMNRLEKKNKRLRRVLKRLLGGLTIDESCYDIKEIDIKYAEKVLKEEK